MLRPSVSSGLDFVFHLNSLVYTHINPLNAELNPICHLLALLGAHHIFHVSRIRVKVYPRIGHDGVEV
jgi:hypothetical protein